ncbi:hypothetical protein GCM10009555_098660 [Acrocarpospora macrocephala]|uniref:Holin n=1 Tax=Acrocarpospora macrocephala TaxID=150177 RepID=A0A5M3X7M9_9ACTN|nr:holin [Acrocarpospora macrocephala]GES16682.1 hypothetical protein Amac_102800 [Acrocarpospora macrocephala]
MHAEPVTYSRPSVEAKVKAMTLTPYFAGVAGMAILQVIADDPSLISFLPDWVEAIVMPLVPTGLAALAGYQARHPLRMRCRFGACLDRRSERFASSMRLPSIAP